MADWLRAEVPAGWRVHLNGNNLAVLPPFLDKAHAVRWFRDHIAGPHPFALGIDRHFQEHGGGHGGFAAEAVLVDDRARGGVEIDFPGGDRSAMMRLVTRL